MASVALDAAMRVTQLVPGIAVVIELRRFPCLLTVAGFAFITETRVVYIVLLVAAIAHRRWLVVERLALVTGQAAGIDVRTEQGKMRAPMIE
jgi:hypothetical protein